MKTNSSINLRRMGRLAGASLLLWISLAPLLTTADGALPLVDQISQKRVFKESLLWVGAEQPSDAESAELLRALDAVQPPNVETGIAVVERFIVAYPNSAWIPSLRANLAMYRRETGRYSEALELWEAAWNQVGLKTGKNEILVGDFVLSQWLRLLASLGRHVEMKEIISQIGNRKLSRMDWRKSLAEVKEAVVTMENNPGVSFKCGTFSVYQVGFKLQQTNSALPKLLRIPSPATGFSLAALEEIARTNGLDMRAVRREHDEQIVVPSVIHWRQHHYAGVVERRGNYYRVVDPTFGGSRWLIESVINAEASGYFLVEKSQIPASWVELDRSNAGAVFGRGYPNIDFGPPTPPCQPSETMCCPPGGSGGDDGGFDGDGGGCGSPLCSPGFAMAMPRWDVTEPDTSLALYDKPMFYQPALGKEFSLKLAYRQRGLIPDNTFPNFGSFWSGGWVEFVEVTPDAGVADYTAYSATRYVGEGGGGWNYTAASGSSGTARDPRNGTKLERLWNSTSNLLEGFKLTEASGNQRIYKFTNMVTLSTGVIRAFMTEQIDVKGYTNRFVYSMTNGLVKLMVAIDADDKTNTVYYENTTFPIQITKVSNPFGHSVVLKYDGDGVLTNLVDVVGLSTSFVYDTNRVAVAELVKMITPYGTNDFKYTGLAGGDQHGEIAMTNVSRSVLVTLPNGANHLFIYRDDSTGSPLYLPGAETDAAVDFVGTTNLLGNAYMWYRNSFHWGPRQYSNLSTTNLATFTAADYLLARRRNYLHLSAIDPATGEAYLFVQSSSASYSPVLNMEQAPSPDGASAGKRTWYGYFGKHALYPNAEGTNRYPAVIVRVMPDNTVNYQYFEYNLSLRRTKEVTTASSEGTVYYRTNLHTYAANGIDLLLTTNYSGAREMAYGYNSQHQVVAATNAVGDVTTYTYAANGDLTSVKSPGGLTTTNLYGGDGRLLQTIDIEISRTNSFTWTNGLAYTHTDERGLTITNTFDALQRLVAKHYPDGTSVSNVYTHLDLTATRDRLGQWTYSAYNSVRRRTAVTNSLSQVTLYNYCICGSLDSVMDALNNTTAYSYDKAGRQIAITFPDGSWVTNNYNSIGQVTNRIESSGLNVTNWYNSQGLLTASSNAFGQMVKYSYNLDDRITNQVDASGVSIVTDYDDLGRIISGTYPDGGVERFSYSSRGLIAHTNQLGNVTRYAYDTARHKVAETNGNAEVTQFVYSPAGDLLTLTDAKNHVTSWNYDQFGRVTNKMDTANTVVFRYKYDAGNRLTNRWSVARGDTFYSYDAVGNLTLINYPLSPDITLSYDSLNRLTNMVDSVGTTRYCYDGIGQLLSEDGPWENDTVTYAYQNRLRSGLSLAQPNASPWTQSYGYDSGRRLVTVNSPAGDFGYSYHAGFGGINSASSLTENLNYPNGTTSANTFDSVGRLTESRLIINSGGVLNEHEYVNNVGNQRTKQTRADGSYADYTYDNVGQLKSALGAESGGTTNRWQERFFYAYDNAGNLSNRVQNVQTNVFHVDNLNQLTSVVRTNNSSTVAGVTTIAATNITVVDNGNSPVAAFRYADRTFARTNVTLLNGNNTFVAVAADGLGRLDTNSVTVNLPTAVTFLYDQNGNMRTNGTRIFQYDDENQIICITEPGAWMSTNVYDGKLRRRIEKNYRWTGSAWLQTNEIRFVYDGNLILQERDGFNLPTITLTRGLDLSRTIRDAGGIGGLLSISDHTVLSLDHPELAHFYIHSDGNGNVTCLADVNQNVVARYLYDPFGNTLSISGPKATLNRYRFSSKPVHDPSGMYDYLYRWYVPELQRWPNRDPILERGGKNLYGFVRNAPISIYDQLGLRYESVGIHICREPGLGGHEWIEYDGGAVGFYPGPSIWGGPGSVQDPDPHRTDPDKNCKNVVIDTCDVDKECFQDCVRNLKSSPPGNYCVIGSNCRDWVSDSLKECRKKCSF